MWQWEKVGNGSVYLIWRIKTGGGTNCINRKVYQFHFRTRMLTAVPYRLYNFDFWCTDSMVQAVSVDIYFQLKWLYRILKDKESIYHLFWCCPQVAFVWSQIQEWQKKCKINRKLTLEIALLGDLERPGQSINNTLLKNIKGKLKQHNVTPSQSHFCEIKLST
jgi:hypothetical protein